MEVAAVGKEDVDRAVFQDLFKMIQERSVEIKRLVGRELGMRSTVPRILKSFKRDRLPDVFRSICARAKEIGELELPADNPADYLHDIVGAALDFTRDNPDQFEPALAAISEATGSFVKRRGRADREYLMADFVPAALQVSRGNVAVLKVVLSETLRVADGIDDATTRWLYLEHTAPSMAQDSSPEGARTYVSSAKYFDRLGTKPLMERLGKDKQLADIRGATRVGVVGDVHANYRETLDALVTAGYADEKGNWVAPPGAVLVFLGDLVDRGDKPWETLEFIFRLSKDAEAKGGRVLALR
jgi:hypothetical protein